MKTYLALGLTALALTACMGREPHPVAVQSERDGSLSCLALNTERDGNRERVRYLKQEQNGSEDMNIVVGSFAVAAFPPAAVALDVSDAQEVEITALNRRNDHIEMLRIAKGCITAPLVPQGYTAFERSQESFQDASGRALTLPSNTYIYSQPPSAPAALQAQQLGPTDLTPQD